MTIASLLKGTTRDEELLLAHVLKKPREYIWSHPEKQVPPAQARTFRGLRVHVAQGMPLPYLTRSMPFAALEFTVTPDVLIPRPETELLVEHALTLLKETRIRHSVVDIGTGSGCIIVSLAHALVRARDRRHMYHAIDIAPPALAVAKRNARRHGVASLITFEQGSLLEPILDRPHIRARPLLVLANLPYLPNTDISRKQTQTHADEPRIALDGGDDGLDLLATLLTQCMALTRPWSLLAEIDPRQEQKLTHDLLPYYVPNRHTEIIKDYCGRSRLLSIE
ncbi:HemK family protein methyltransferase [Candidatus Uhrbacteria bacterium]|nr:HemK family protein methyltransferase [Candidatus Uhrbacteria bacterium]